MALSNSTNEHTNRETVELFIIKTLLKGGDVIIPDFGRLELKSLGDRRTVLFKPTESSDSFLQPMSAIEEKGKKDTVALYAAISVPLKEEKIVNLPQIGVFRPVKRENGKIHVSFILSSYLRKLLNQKGESVEAITEEKKEIEEIKKIPDIPEKKDEVQKVETVTDKISVTKSSGSSTTSDPKKNSKVVHKSSPTISYQRKSPKVGDRPAPPPKDISKKSESKSLRGTLLLIVVVSVLIIFGILYVYNKKSSDKVVLTIQNESINLPVLAEQYYGHSVFWIYIYEANSDKLKSPINIPKKDISSLVIPDLKAEFDVDVTDSMEIQRANILCDIVLKKIKNINK